MSPLSMRGIPRFHKAKAVKLPAFSDQRMAPGRIRKQDR
jgi:hypothetical protein